MGLSRLAEQCRKCPFKDNCKNKRIEALGYLPEPIVAEAGASSAAELTQPILRETVNTIIDGKVVKVYKDEKNSFAINADDQIIRNVRKQFAKLGCIIKQRKGLRIKPRLLFLR